MLFKSPFFPLTLTLNLVLTLFTSSCSHPSNWRKKSYEKVQKGMNKGDVLEHMGSPRSTDRKMSVDRWYYHLEPEDPHSTHVIYFKKNKVIYKGLPIPALISAEKADASRVNTPRNMGLPQLLTPQELLREIKKELSKERKKKNMSRKTQRFKPI